MTKATSVHNHRVGRNRWEHAFSGCVAVRPQDCRELAHGGVTWVEECSCGLRRKVNANTGTREYQRWERWS